MSNRLTKTEPTASGETAIASSGQSRARPCARSTAAAATRAPPPTTAISALNAAA